MENEKVVSPTPTPEVVESTVPPVVEKVKKKGKGKFIVIGILAFLLLCIGGYIVYTEFFNTPEEVIDTEEEDLEEEEIVDEDTGVCNVGDDCEEEVVTEEDTEFNGEVISASLPTGWSIVEYFDGDGTDSLPEGFVYTGLTAIDILNPQNKQVFTLQAISGVGFAGCPEYPMFSDNGESYLFEQQNASDEMGDTLNIVDYTGQAYIEFEFLNTTFRRIGEKYFYDTQEGNNYFEPPCVDGLLTLEGLYFEDSDGYKYEAYVYGATEDSTEADLLIVDSILESFSIN